MGTRRDYLYLPLNGLVGFLDISKEFVKNSGHEVGIVIHSMVGFPITT